MPSSPIDPRGSISRRDYIRNRPVWLTFALMFGVIAISVAGIAILFPRYSDARLLPFAAALGAVAIVAAIIEPPAIDSWKNHVALLCVPVFTALGMVAFQPHSVVPAAAAMFAAPFTAGRLIDRRQLLAHYVAATLILLAPIAFLHVDTTAQLAMLTMVPAVWALAIGAVIVLEAAERQSEELSRIGRRDPLTGIGNRRLLWETFEAELPMHREGGTELSVITMDLNGFKRLNDTVGHDAGDRLLQRVAQILEREIDHQGTIVRQGGDEFCIVLPMTAGERAATLVASLRKSLEETTDGVASVTSGFGIAVFPEDGDTGDELLAVADTRLTADKITPRLLTGGASGARIEGPAEPFHELHPIVRLVDDLPADAADELPGQHHAQQFLRLSRTEIATNPFVWRLIGGMWAICAVMSAACYALSSDAGPAALAFTVVFGVATVIALRSEPPTLRSWLNHLVLAVPYVGSAVFAFAFRHEAGLIMGPLAFTGTLTSVRLVNRAAIVAHLALATLAVVVIMAFAHLGESMDLALALTVLVMWGMSFGDIVYLEAAEAQGDELETLVRRDPLTGAGNRRLLGEQLAHEIRRHSGARKSFTVIALDLNGFKALNDGIGHAAGDELLAAVATRLQKLARTDDTVIRQGGDEFCVILPDTDAATALPIMNAIRTAIAGLSTDAHPISTGAGMATYPTEAATSEVILHVADERLRRDKQSMAGVRRRSRDGDLHAGATGPGDARGRAAKGTSPISVVPGDGAVRRRGESR